MDAQLLFGAPPKSPQWLHRLISYLCIPWACFFVFLVAIHLAPALPLSQSSSSSIFNGRFLAVRPIVKMMPSALHVYTSTGNRGLYLAKKAQPGNGDGDGDGDDTQIDQAEPNEETDPSRWNRETSPFVAVRPFVDDCFADEYIRDMLRNNSINTMEEAIEKYCFIIPFLKNQDKDRSFSDAVRAAEKKEQKTAEEIVGGNIDYDDKDISPDIVERFSKEAVAVTCSNTDNRNGVYSLVMGPSGSGKTLFAMKSLGPAVFSDAGGNEKQIYTILVQAKTIKKVNSTSTKVTFESSLTAYVKGIIDSRGIPTDRTLLQLAMLVIIDEAGGHAYEYFDTDEKIRALHSFLESNLRYKFAKRLHLAVVGTGLEVPTQAIDSKKDAIKFRMQPWSLGKFAAMVEKSKHADKAKAIKKCVRTFPIFQHLASNARCAYFLMESLAPQLPNETSTKKNVPFQSFVDSIISNVAHRYIGSNGLTDMKDDEEKIPLARAVFREITKANNRPKRVFFPDFDDLGTFVRRVANSLLDVHVESVNDELRLINNKKNSVSMTPALAVVLARLLDEDGNISWGWRGMESIVALAELKIVIQNMSDKGKLGGILRSESAIPGLRATKNFVVPVIGNSLVVLNGDNAPYADVIAPFRLVQAKFSVDREKRCKIDLYEEVGKMGLATAVDKYRLNQAVTSVFHCLWKNKQKRVKYRSMMSRRADYRIHRASLYDPFQTLLCEVKTTYAKIACHFDNTTNLVTIETDRETDGETDKELLPRQIPALLDFDDRPVTAVFVTNCQSFELQKNVIITRKDVKWDGKLKRAKAKEVADLVPNLRENVEFQFVIL